MINIVSPVNSISMFVKFVTPEESAMTLRYIRGSNNRNYEDCHILRHDAL